MAGYLKSHDLYPVSAHLSSQPISSTHHSQQSQSDIPPYTSLQLQLDIQIQFQPQLQSILLLHIAARSLALASPFLLLWRLGAVGERSLCIISQHKHSAADLALPFVQDCGKTNHGTSFILVCFPLLIQDGHLLLLLLLLRCLLAPSRSSRL